MKGTQIIARILFPSGPFAFLATACLSFLAGAAASAESAPRVFRPLTQLKSVVRVRGMPGECVQLDRRATLPRCKLPQVLSGDFTVRAWIRPDVLPSYGPGGFSDEGPPTIIRFGGPKREDGFAPTLVFRIRRHFLEVVWLSPDGASSIWRSVMGRTWLPARRWLFAAAVRRGDVMELYVDGHPDGRAAGARAGGAYTWCEIGHTGGKRRFTGRMAGLAVEPRAVTAESLRAIVAAVPGYRPMRVPQVDRRWLRAGLLFSQPREFPYYRAMRVGPDVLHPLTEGCGLFFCSIPAREGLPDLLIGADARLFGARIALHHAVGCDPGTAWSRPGWPVYDPGRTLELGERTSGLNGDHFVFWKRDAADRIALLGRREGRLFLWRSRGSGEPSDFEVAGPVLFGGKALPEALPPGMHPYEWRPGDVDGDGRRDMLITAWWGDPRDDWPYGERRLGARNPHVGPGRGYDITGRWLGAYRNATLFWARGVRSPEDLPRFGPVQPVYFGDRPRDYAVQWRVPNGIMTPALLTVGGRRWVLLFGDVDRVLALPVRPDADGTVRCGDPLDLLADHARLSGTYFQNQMETVDIDNDGRDEVLIGGNPGRIIVLDGPDPGAFVEAGSLSVRGGWVAVDTLSVPCVLDWDGDGRRDLVLGDASGMLSFWPGTQNPLEFGTPVWFRAGGRIIRHRAGYSGSLQGPGEAGWGYLQPVAADWDQDADPDIIANDITGKIVFYERANAPFDLRPARPFVTDNGTPLPVAWRSRPGVIPAASRFHGFARPCLLYLDDASHLCAGVPEKTGATRIVSIVLLRYRDGTPVRLSGEGTLSGRTKLCVTDWDGDGDWDVLFGTNVGCYPAFVKDPPPCSTPMWLQNVGSNRDPVFAEPRVIRLADGGFINLRVHECSPWAVDMDGDGTPDLVTGAEDGKVYVFYRRELSRDGPRPAGPPSGHR